MKRIIIACLLLAGMSSQQVVRADEGMWLPLLLKRLNYEDMKRKAASLQPMKFIISIIQA